MDKKRKKIILNLLGIFLILLGLIRIIQLLFFGVPMHVFWLCNHVIVIIGVAILLRNQFILIGEFSFLFIGQLIWIIGFLMFNIFGIIFEGNSTYLIYDSIFINLITILVHFLTLPLAFWAILLLNKKEKFAWITGLVHSAVLAPIVLLFPHYNLNCLNSPCLAIFPDTLLYSILIIPGYFLLTIIPLNYLVNLILSRINK
jgi:hypothetical protein